MKHLSVSCKAALWGAGSLMLLGAILAGCNQREPITLHQNVRITRPDPVATPGASSQLVDSRMIVAIFQQPTATWFFKISGPTELIDTHHAKWQSLIETVEFDAAGQPQWSDRDGWERTAGNEFRYATLSSNEPDGQLEVAISQLPTGQDLLDNVNRWLGQLSQPNVGQGDLEKLLMAMDSGKTPCLLFDQRGKMGAPSLGGPLGGGAGR